MGLRLIGVSSWLGMAPWLRFWVGIALWGSILPDPDRLWMIAMNKSLILTPALLAAAVLFAPAAEADPCDPHTRLRPPRIEPELPRFGMRTQNIGRGELVVSVRPGGVACQLGLEPGDIILRLNHDRLNYHGSWWDALGHAMHDGGRVRLLVEDHYTGRLSTRRIDFPVQPLPIDYGPITPKARVVDYRPRVVEPVVVRSPVAPRVVTPRVVTPRFVPAQPRIDHRDRRDTRNDRERFLDRKRRDRRGERRGSGVSFSIGGGSSRLSFRLP